MNEVEMWEDCFMGGEREVHVWAESGLQCLGRQGWGSSIMSMRWCSVALSNQMQMKHIPRYHLISLEVYRELERGGDMG